MNMPVKLQNRSRSKPPPLESIPVLSPEQRKIMRRLVRRCCNYDNGSCIALDDGDGCVCVQRISHSLICRWFRKAVLPTNRELKECLLSQQWTKKCIVCGTAFLPGSNSAKYCPVCVAKVRLKKEAMRLRDRYRSTHLDSPKAP